MNTILIFAITYFFSINVNCSPLSYFSNSDIINVKHAVSYLNSNPGRTWTAGGNDFGEYFSKSQQEARMGSLNLENNANDLSASVGADEDYHLNKNNDDKIDEHVFHPDELPDHYDARAMFPHCTTISSIKDQSQCGSCWAVSTASAFSDRLCIHSKGLININASSNHLLSCTIAPGVNGCHGGWEEEGWNFIKQYGVVSGGDYGTFDGCQPYSIKPCGKEDQMPCEQVDETRTPICRQTQCTNEWYNPEEEIYKVKSTLRMPCNYTHPCNEIDIRREIYLNGPVTAAFKVYWPFYLYSSGIFYMDLSNFRVPNGGHAIRIIGWGVENNIPYWIAANSWGRRWGENGFFRILRGRNFCQIESYINSGIPDIPFEIN